FSQSLQSRAAFALVGRKNNLRVRECDLMRLNGLMVVWMALPAVAWAMAPADLDRDGDVDQDDFGHFQACITGADEPQTLPDCVRARLDDDADVDADDFNLFAACVSGPTIPAVPPCTPVGRRY